MLCFMKTFNHVLGILSKSQERCYRFQCLVYNEFNTGMNPKTNLARCFSCRKNYNTIDLAMAVKALSFIDSVAYLEKIKTTILFSAKKAHAPEPTPSRFRDTVKSSKPVALGDIFKSLATSTPNTSPIFETMSERQLRIFKKESLYWKTTSNF